VAGVTSQQVLYRSTDALGEPIAVSGTVLVPAAPWTGPGSRPLVAYAVGTRGVGDDCAPSYTLTQGADYEGAIVKALLDRGWAVAVSDYQGLGTPGLHTYMVGPAQGHAVLDIARAALRLPGTGLSASTPVGLMGYSQGGGAAGWAAELAGSYAPDLDVKGSAVGGVPADLTATAEFLDGSPFVAFALLAALGLDTAYPELDLESYLNTRGRQLVATSQELCLVSVDGFATLISVAFTRFDDYVTTNPLGTPPWQARLEETRLGKAAPSAPVLQYHALFDEIIPLDQAAHLRRRWCDQGADITWSTLPIAEHALGWLQGQTPAADWLAQRFAGQPTAANCQQP
jgi:Secretory lipase